MVFQVGELGVGEVVAHTGAATLSSVFYIYDARATQNVASLLNFFLFFCDFFFQSASEALLAGVRSVPKKQKFCSQVKQLVQLAQLGQVFCRGAFEVFDRLGQRHKRLTTRSILMSATAKVATSKHIHIHHIATRAQ